jgi:hypothetical protein
MARALLAAALILAIPGVGDAKDDPGAGIISGVAAGAAGGAIVGGPVGAVIGGVGGAIVGGDKADRSDGEETQSPFYESWDPVVEGLD